MHTQDAIDMVPSLPWLEETKIKRLFLSLCRQNYADVDLKVDTLEIA